VQKLKDCTQERSPIINITMFQKNLLVYVTQYAGIKILDCRTCVQKDKLVSSKLNMKTIATAFSPDEKLLAFAHNNTFYIFSLENKNIIKTTKIANDAIDKMIFSEDSLYLLIATKNGRILKYRYNNSSLIDRLYSFRYKQKPSYATAITRYKNKLACGGNDGSLAILDPDIQMKRNILMESGEKIDCLCFVDENKLISADASGTLKVYQLDKSKLIQTIHAPFTNINHIIPTQNKNNILISSSEENYICAIDIEKGVILKTHYIDCENTVNFMIISNENLLCIITKEKLLQKVKLPVSSDLQQLIENNELAKAYKLIEEEPLLNGYAEYEILEQKYHKIYLRILEALIDNDKTEALKLKKLVINIKSKEADIQTLFRAFEHYPQLKKYYIGKQYALAYGLVMKHPPLQYTPIYKQLEEKFLNAFVNAKRHIELNNVPHAKALLQEYITVISKRPIIKLLLQKDKDFLQFLKAIDKKNFQIQEELLLKHPIFKLAPTYKKPKQSIEETIDTIEYFINDGNLLEAKSLLLQLKATQHIKPTLIFLAQKIQQVNKLQYAYKENDFKTCYELLDKFHFLNDTKLGILLNNYWVKVIKKSEIMALNGDMEGVLNQLSQFLDVQSRKYKIGSLLRLASLSKIKSLIAKENYEMAKNLLYSHIDIFGLDNEVRALMELYESLSKDKLAITQEQNERRDRNRWTKESILQKYILK